MVLAQLPRQLHCGGSGSNKMNFWQKLTIDWPCALGDIAITEFVAAQRTIPRIGMQSRCIKKT
jgi:hypothetical protein